MTTAILVVVMIVIIVAVFYVGMFVGGYAIGKTTAEAIGKALDETNLTILEKLNILDAIKKYSKK